MEPPTCQTTLKTRMRSRTRGRSMTRSISLTPQAIIIDSTETAPSLDYTNLFKILNDMLEDRIKLAMEVQFTPLQNMFAQVMEATIRRKMITLSNIIAEVMNRTMDKKREHNVRLRTQVADSIREVRSTVVAKTTPTWNPPTTATYIRLISDLVVEAAAEDRLSHRQHAAGKITLHPQHTHQSPRPTPAATLTPTYLHLLACLSMAAAAAAAVSTLPVQQWTTVLWKGKTIPMASALISNRGNVLERSIAKEYSGLAKEPSETKRQIQFSSKTETPQKD